MRYLDAEGSEYLERVARQISDRTNRFERRQQRQQPPQPVFRTPAPPVESPQQPSRTSHLTGGSAPRPLLRSPVVTPPPLSNRRGRRIPVEEVEVAEEVFSTPNQYTPLTAVEPKASLDRTQVRTIVDQGISYPNYFAPFETVEVMHSQVVNGTVRAVTHVASLELPSLKWPLTSGGVPQYVGSTGVEGRAWAKDLCAVTQSVLRADRAFEQKTSTLRCEEVLNHLLDATRPIPAMRAFFQNELYPKLEQQKSAVAAVE